MNEYGKVIYGSAVIYNLDDKPVTPEEEAAIRARWNAANKLSMKELPSPLLCSGCGRVFPNCQCDED